MNRAPSARGQASHEEKLKQQMPDAERRLLEAASAPNLTPAQRHAATMDIIYRGYTPPKPFTPIKRGPPPEDS